MAGESDADVMRRFIAAAGSQQKAADQLGISKSMVSLIVREKRSGERYREAAERGAAGEEVTPPPPGPRTPRRNRRPVRQDTGRGGSRIVCGTPRLLGREIERTGEMGREVSGFSVQVVATRIESKPRASQTYVGTLTISQPTEDQLTDLAEGNEDGVRRALQTEHPWLEKIEIISMTYTD